MDSSRRRPQRSEKQKDISDRRKNLYNRVVRPLAWLAIKGFNSNSGETTYINKMTDTTVTATQSPPPALRLQLNPNKEHSIVV